MRRIGTNSSLREELVSIIHTCEESHFDISLPVTSNYGISANIECSSFVGYFIDVRNLHDCHMKFDYVHISLTHEKYWYEIGDILVPIIRAM